jgi:hypothetical protein
VVDVVEADPEDLGDVVAEHVGHEDVGVLAFAHVHGVGDVAHHVQVGVEQLQSCVEEVHLELLPLLPPCLPRQDLIDEFEVRCLHDFYDPPEVELHAVLLHLVGCLRSFLLVLGPGDLNRPTAQQQVLDYVLLAYLASLAEDTIEDQLYQLLELHLQELSAHLQHYLAYRLSCALALNLQLHELFYSTNTFSPSLSDYILVTFLISACRMGVFL